MAIKLHCNPVQVRTGGVQGTTCLENPVTCKHVFPVIKAGFSCENVGTGNPCFHYRDQVFSVV